MKQASISWSALALASLLPLGAAAAPVWQQYDNVSSWLDNNWTYSSDAGTRTGTVSFTNQSASNTGATTERLGIYIGWAWSYVPGTAPGSWIDTPLPWDNATQAFTNGSVSMSVSYLSASAGLLTLGDVVGDTWIGNPWAPAGEIPIATQAGWSVPFIDLGVLAPGASTSYDVTITLRFADDASFNVWNQSGSFYIGGQGVRDIPEPSVLWLVALALLSAAAVRTGRTGRAGPLSWRVAARPCPAA